MEGHQLEIGRIYAFREKRATSSPLLTVKLIDKVGRKGKLKVRFEDGGHPGLEEYVSTRQMLCTWGDRKVVLRGPDANIEMTIIFTLRQGRVVSLEYFWDHAEALKAVGLEE